EFQLLPRLAEVRVDFQPVVGGKPDSRVEPFLVVDRLYAVGRLRVKAGVFERQRGVVERLRVAEPGAGTTRVECAVAEAEAGEGILEIVGVFLPGRRLDKVRALLPVTEAIVVSTRPWISTVEQRVESGEAVLFLRQIANLHELLFPPPCV